MTIGKFEKEKKKLAPESGFNLIGIDYFSGNEGELYLIRHFEFYQDALKAKKERKNQEDQPGPVVIQAFSIASYDFLWSFILSYTQTM